MKKEELIVLLKEYKENKAKLNIKLKELKLARINLKACDEIDTSITVAYGQNQDIVSSNWHEASDSDWGAIRPDKIFAILKGQYN